MDRPTARGDRTATKASWISVALLFSLAAAGCSETGGSGVVVPPPPPPPPPAPPPPPPPPAATGSVSGIVRSLLTGAPVEGARVSIGFESTISDNAGRFEFDEIVAGSATIKCISAGFVPYEATITVTSGTINHDIQMGTQEVWAMEDVVKFTIFVPSGVTQVRGAIVLLGGPDTRGFADGKTPFGTPDPTGEAVLREFGDSLEVVARKFGLAILGTEERGLPSGVATDDFITGALSKGGSESGHLEIATAPILMIGISGGGPESIGLAHRNPARTIGVLVRVPSRNHNAVMSPTDALFLQVPLLMITGEFDTVVDVPYLRTLFHQVRGFGGLWGYTEIPGATHFTAPPQVWSLMVGWTRAILEQRLPSSITQPLNQLSEESGWLGDNAGRDASPWADYSGDRSSATWLPTSAVAALWLGVVLPP